MKRRNDGFVGPMIGMGALGCLLYVAYALALVTFGTVLVIGGFTVFEWLFFDLSWYNGPF